MNDWTPVGDGATGLRGTNISVMTRGSVVAAWAVLAAACGRGTPAAPTTATATTVVTPLVLSARPVAPASGSLLPFVSQPLSLLVSIEPTPTAPAAVTVVDVAADSGFTRVLQTTSVPLKGGETATVTLNPLAAGATYYWRTRSSTGGETLTSTTFSFAVSEAIMIVAPLLLPARIIPQPTYVHPRLYANESTPQSNPTHYVYRYEVAVNPSFLPLAAGGAGVHSGSSFNFDITTWRVPIPLELGTTYYWRVQATDPATNASVYSSTATFTTLPPTANGKASLHIYSSCTQSYAYPFDGVVTVDGSRLVFTADRGGYATQLRLDVTVEGAAVQGTLVGRAYERMGHYNTEVWDGGPQLARVPSVVTGKIEGDGRLTGVISTGRVGFWDVYGDGGACSTATNARNTFVLFPR